jgi:hypothetical protein
MPQTSFRWFARSFIPFRNPRKQAIPALLVLVLAGCGGGGGGDGQAEQRVRGLGYAFSAPAEWQVSRRAMEIRVEEGTNLLSVRRYALQRAFQPQLWDQVVPEFDQAADEVAAQQNATVNERKTMKIASRDARHYKIDYEHNGQELTEELGFVLRGKTEYLLLCRYERGGDRGACERLLATFSLSREG